MRRKIETFTVGHNEDFQCRCGFPLGSGEKAIWMEDDRGEAWGCSVTCANNALNARLVRNAQAYATHHTGEGESAKLPLGFVSTEQVVKEQPAVVRAAEKQVTESLR